VSGGGRQSPARPELGWSGPNDWAGAEKNKGKMNQEGLGLEMFFTPTLNGKNFLLWNLFRISFMGLLFKSNWFKHFQTNFEPDSKENKIK
jgi:hypothetical protein